MGIINVTPDSFSGDGLAHGRSPLVEAALAQARLFVDAGVDILDVGGESTRPDAPWVTADEELERVAPVIEALRAEFDTPISIDTYKAAVAEAALRLGADIVNDVWGFRADPEIAAVTARYRAPAILMNNRAAWAPKPIRPQLGSLPFGRPYQDLLADVCRELLESAALALAAGVPRTAIILDPGVGFGKTVAENLALVDRLGEIRALGYPVLLGPSRKSFIGKTLDLPPDQRLEGTAAAVAIGIARGADIIRVHDVELMLRVTRMADAIVRRNKV
jgi:dihydropteroate synthase